MFFKKIVDKKNDKVKIDIIPKTNEEYISVIYGCIRFIDSYRFLSSSLDLLVRTLVDNKHQTMKTLKKEIVDNDEVLNIVIEIGEPPVDNLEKEYFFSKLKSVYLSDEDIERTKEVIKLFNIKNVEEPTQTYLKNDVLLLTCVFENFIKVSVNEFGINPLYFVSQPGYTWQCGLKYTGINLQTLQDKDMLLLLENNLRGGISSVMGDRYVKSDKNKKIIYADANKLYGHSMSQPLPYDETEFDENVKSEETLNIPHDSDIGYFIEVDLSYPDNIKQKTKNFPFAPENKKNIPDKFNDYMKKLTLDTYTQTKKLICDWSDKKKYLIPYCMLKFYVRHGMTVDKVHDIISFRQSKWLEKYVNFNTQKRNQAVNDFVKDF